MVDFLRHSFFISYLKKKVNRKGIETQKQDSKRMDYKLPRDKMTDIQHQTPSIWKKYGKMPTCCHTAYLTPFQPSIIGKGSTYLRDDEDRHGFTISVVPTPSVFIYQLWSKFHWVFNKSNRFTVYYGYSYMENRSFEIEKDYKERLNFRKTTKKDYKRCIDIVRLLAS